MTGARDAQRADARSRVRMALFSVYFHAARDSAAAVDPAFRPIALDEAARILAIGASRPSGDSASLLRRRRAIATLAAAGLGPPRESALRILEAPIAQIQRAFDDAQATDPLLDRTRREAIVYSIVQGPLGAAPCVPSDPVVTVRRANGAATAEVQLTVQRAATELPVAMDPQRWDECNAYFEAAYVVAPDAPQLTRGQEPKPHPRPPAPGTTWRASLFEHFVIDWQVGGYAYFKNLLSIRSELGGAAPFMTFALGQAIDGAIGGIFGRYDATVTEDVGGGHARMTLPPDKWAVGATKTIRISSSYPGIDKWLEMVLPHALESMGDEIAEGVCCPPPRASTG